jgi:hypothetical protein
MAICPAVVVENLKFFFCIHWHHAMTFILHVLLASVPASKLFAAEETKFTEMDSLGEVRKQAS